MSFRGAIAELPVGAQGWNSSKNVNQLQPGHLVIARNITFENGTIQKERGAEKHNSSAIEDSNGDPVRILAGHDWVPEALVQRLTIFTSDGRVLQDRDGDGNFSTELVSGLGVDSRNEQIFVEGGAEEIGRDKKLFLFSLGSMPQVLVGDGITMAEIGDPPTDWTSDDPPSFGVNHAGRIFAGGTRNDPHRVYWSTADDHEDFVGSGSGSISVFPGKGEVLAAAATFRGVLVLFKFPRGVYLVDTRPVDQADWSVTELTDSIGTNNPQSLTHIENDLLFVDHVGGIHALSAVQEFGNAMTSEISREASLDVFVRENVNLEEHHRINMIYHKEAQTVHIGLQSLGGLENDRRITYHVPSRRFQVSDRDDKPVSMFLRKEDEIEKPYFGDDAGFVWKAYRETREVDGTGYQIQFESPPTALGFVDPKLATRHKNGQFLELVVEPAGQWNLSVTILWDGFARETVQFDMGEAGAELGSFELGTSRLGGGKLLNKKRRITGSGRRFSLIGRNSGAGEDISVSQFFLHFTVGAEEQAGTPA